MGSEYKSANLEQLAELGVTIVNLPSFRPELKGSSCIASSITTVSALFAAFPSLRRYLAKEASPMQTASGTGANLLPASYACLLLTTCLAFPMISNTYFLYARKVIIQIIPNNNTYVHENVVWFP